MTGRSPARAGCRDQARIHRENIASNFVTPASASSHRKRCDSNAGRRFGIRLGGCKYRRVAYYSYLKPGIIYSGSQPATTTTFGAGGRGAGVHRTALVLADVVVYLRDRAGGHRRGGGRALYITRRRLHKKMERLERQRVLENERARIAKDIHDDLGSSLARIMLLSQSDRAEGRIRSRS